MGARWSQSEGLCCDRASGKMQQFPFASPVFLCWAAGRSALRWVQGGLSVSCRALGARCWQTPHSGLPNAAVPFPAVLQELLLPSAFPSTCVFPR